MSRAAASSDQFVDRLTVRNPVDRAATLADTVERYNDGGIVNVADLNALGQNWLGRSDSWRFGDFNADGTVDAGDLNKLGQN